MKKSKEIRIPEAIERVLITLVAGFMGIVWVVNIFVAPFWLLVPFTVLFGIGILMAVVVWME